MAVPRLQRAPQRLQVVERLLAVESWLSRQEMRELRLEFSLRRELTSLFRLEFSLA